MSDQHPRVRVEARRVSRALVAAAVAIGAAGLIAVIALVRISGDPNDRDVPTGAECEQLADRESPDLQAQAARILEDASSLTSFVDCESGGYPAVYGGTSDLPEEIIGRMRKLGTATRIENTECLKYLAPAECGDVWTFAPRDGDWTYIVELPPSDVRGEFSIARDR